MVQQLISLLKGVHSPAEIVARRHVYRSSLDWSIAISCLAINVNRANPPQTFSTVTQTSHVTPQRAQGTSDISCCPSTLTHLSQLFDKPKVFQMPFDGIHSCRAGIKRSSGRRISGASSALRTGTMGDGNALEFESTRRFGWHSIVPYQRIQRTLKQSKLKVELSGSSGYVSCAAGRRKHESDSISQRFGLLSSLQRPHYAVGDQNDGFGLLSAPPEPDSIKVNSINQRL